MRSLKFVSTALSLLMAFSLFSGMVSAGEDSSSEDNSPLQLKKTATLQDDGTYTIDLEAYVTGKVVTQVEKKNKPTDIVLVLDQSGSMADSMSGLPDDTYTSAGKITNADAYAGSYYYKSGDVYYPVIVKYASTDGIEKYTDNAGNAYQDSDVSYTWKNNNGVTLNANGPFLKSSLITFHRWKRIFTYYYIPDGQTDSRSNAVSSGSDQVSLRNGLREKYSDKTVQFDNSDYTAAVYTQLTPVYRHTYEYFYLDSTGKMQALPTVGQSNEETCPYDLYVRGDKKGTKLDVLKYAVNKFVSGVEADAETNGVDHRVAIVGFSTGATALTGQNEAALQSVKSTTGINTISKAIDQLKADGATRSDLGFQEAQSILSSRQDKTRDSVVVFFTDGSPTSTSGFEDEVAADTINKAKELKIGEKVSSAKQSKDTPGGMPTGEKLGYQSSVYTIAVYEGASPTGSANINGSGSVQINDFLHMVSSNYPNARGENQNSRGWEYFREAGANDGYYMVADNAAALANIFTTITNNIHHVVTEVELGSDAILRDVTSEYFTLPVDYDPASSITVRTARYLGNGTWEAAVDDAAVSVAVNGNIIDVTNFDYGNNAVAEASDGEPARGKKIIVSVKGVVAKDSAATGAPVFTNAAASGIYSSVEGEEVPVLIKQFSRPTVTIGRQSYVMDYAKPIILSNLGKATHFDLEGMNRFTTEGVDKLSLPTLSYGFLSRDNNGDVVYNPATMNWDGYDKLYSFTDTVTGWSKVSVIPANNVYYEDDFITSEATGVVGIEYTGNWETDGENSGNTEEANSPVHGWIDSLQDDTGYSDGSAHKADVTEGTATATFTFTGRGVDVYSRTNMTTGTVLVSLKGTNENGEKVGKYLIVDNLAASAGEDGYYQIPTVFFNGLDYGTYTVTIKVTTAAEGRYTYYLDGIRIYNPLSDQKEQEEPVKEAYGDEAGSQFVTLRDYLLDASSEPFTTGELGSGVLFIDQITDASGNDSVGSSTKDVGIYRDFGPKNEIYLGKGQSIAFVVGTDVNNYVGLKAPSGTATARFTNGSNASEVALSAADSYYKIIPNENGIVCIENTGDGLLSVTKLRTTGESGIGELSDSIAVLDYANCFDALEVVDYRQEDAGDEDISSGDVSGDEPSGDVVIENPEEPENPDPAFSMSLLEKLFRIIRGWFRP